MSRHGDRRVRQEINFGVGIPLSSLRIETNSDRRVPKFTEPVHPETGIARSFYTETEWKAAGLPMPSNAEREYFGDGTFYKADDG